MINFQIGNSVRVKQSVEAYYSNYGGKPKLELTPEIVGIVGAVRVPYVCKSRGNGDYFVCVDYLDPASNQIERAGVSYGNLLKAT